MDLIKEYGQEEYDFNEAVLNKILKSYDLEFHQLFIAKPHVFISRLGNSYLEALMKYTTGDRIPKMEDIAFDTAQRVSLD